MPVKNKYTPLSTTLAWMLALGSISLQGVSADEADKAEEMDEIIIMGEKVGRTLFDTYSSVAVITGAELEERSLETVADILDQMANVSGRSGGEGFSIRGIPNFNVTGGSGAALSSVVIDGATMSAENIRFGQDNTWDLQQVEVFRGAQSTNQGRNAMVGAIVLRTADPTYEVEGKVRLSYASYNTYAISGVINLPLIKDQLAIRLSADVKDSDGYITNTTLDTDRYGKRQNQSFRGKVLFEPAGISGLRNIFTVNYSNNDRGDDFIVGPDFTGDRTTEANILGERNADQLILTWEADYEINDIWSISNVFSFNKSNFSRRRDFDRTAGGGEDSRNDLGSEKRYSEELRFHFNGERLHGFFGGFYFDQSASFLGDDTGIVTLAQNLEALGQPPATAAYIASFYDNPFLVAETDEGSSDIKNRALFFNADYEITDKLTLHGGLRYDHEEIRSNGSLTIGSLFSPLANIAAAPPSIQPTLAFVNGALTDFGGTNIGDPTLGKYSAWLPQLGVTYKFSDQLSLSLLTKWGYRAGGAEQIADENGDGIPDDGAEIEDTRNIFRPEHMKTYEATLRSRFWDNRGSLDLTVFHTDWSDQQVFILEPGAILPERIKSNAGVSDVDGFELEFKAQPMDELDVYASMGYTHARFTKFVQFAGLGNELDYSGFTFPHSPKWTLAGGATWRNEMGVFAHGNINYQSMAFGDVEQNLLLDARTIVNAKIGYQGDNYTVTGFVTNLFNSEHVAFRNVTGFLKPGAPRIFGVEFRLNL